ncbi:MAG: hypothetical protein R2699_13695 [Acidimicrobiales bacterium]
MPDSRRPAPVELETLAIDAATRAADLLLDGLHQQRTAVRTKSSGTDMVTEMDQAAEALLVDVLLRPTRRRRPRRGGHRPAGDVGRAVDHRPARRHHQLPVPPSGVRRERRRRRR